MTYRNRRPARVNRPAQTLTLGVVILVVILVAVGLGYYVLAQVRGVVANSQMLPNFTGANPTSQSVIYEPGAPLPRWQGTDRVNLLLMGVDERESQEGPWRTDTMMVLTIDPVLMSGGMLSIPRDLWVPIPGFDDGRINTAHYLGDAYDYPGGGPALAMKTVQYNLGIPIHHYVRLNFSAFEQLVDMIGGIDVYVDQEIIDPTYPDSGYGYDPLYIPSGWNHFDGVMALKYARTRHSLGGDFDRAKRQQQVLMAIFEQITRLDMLPQLIPQAPRMWEMLSSSVSTDLTLDQIVALAVLASEVPQDHICSAVIDEYYTEFWTTPDGQQVLVPDREVIRQLRDELFAALPPGETPSPAAEATLDPFQQVAAEAASVAVLNGTTVTGLAGSTATRLEQQGITVTRIDNADRDDYTASVIIDHHNKLFTAALIAQVLGLPQSAIVHTTDPAAEQDVVVILGTDYQSQ